MNKNNKNFVGDIPFIAIFSAGKAMKHFCEHYKLFCSTTVFCEIIDELFILVGLYTS